MANAILRYRKATFFSTFILLAFALIFLNIFFGLTFFKNQAILIIAILVSAALLIVLGVSPFLTHHTLSDTDIQLRQGWYFRAVVPLSNIERIQVVERGPMRTGVFFEVVGKALYVTTQRGDLILLSLRQPQRFGFAWGKRAGRVYFDTIDKNIVLRRMAEKALTPANQDRSS